MIFKFYIQVLYVLGGFASFTSIPIDPLLFALLITGSVVIILCCGICYLLRRRCCRVSPDKPTANGKRQKSRIQVITNIIQNFKTPDTINKYLHLACKDYEAN